MQAIVTRYDAGQQAELAGLMQAYLGRTLSPWRQDFTALVGQAGEQVNGIYEADYRDFNRDTYARGRQTFDATYAGFKRLLLASWRRDELARGGGCARPGARLMARRRLTAIGGRSARGTGARPPRAPPAPSPASPPRPPAPRRSRRWPRPCAMPATWGRLVLDLAHDAIAPDHLVRDRLPAEDADMEALRESIRAHGQRTPMEVTPLQGALPYGLISGWRRLAALRALYAETGDPRFATVQALVRRPETAAAAYVAMVEENEIPAGAQPVRARAGGGARCGTRASFPPRTRRCARSSPPRAGPSARGSGRSSRSTMRSTACCAGLAICRSGWG